MATTLLKYLKQNSFEKLTEEFNISVKESILFPELVCLTYSQLNTPKNDITNDCRGIVINKNTLEVICYPFTRFNDYNPKIDIGFNFNNFKTYEKIDGSLMSIYFYKDQWRVSSKSTCDAHGKVLSQDCTYGEYFWKVFKKLGYQFPTEENMTFIFEFKFPSDSQFITKCKTESITLIGCRYNDTFKEVDVDFIECNWKKVENKILTFEEVLQKSRKLNPTISEGFVVCDYRFRRIKVKSPAYDLIALLKSPSDDYLKNLKSKQDNFTRLIQISQVTEFNDFLNYKEHCREDYNKIVKAQSKLLHELYKALKSVQGFTLQEMGKIAKSHVFDKHLFQLAKINDIDVFVKNMSKDNYVNYIKHFLK